MMSDRKIAIWILVAGMAFSIAINVASWFEAKSIMRQGREDAAAIAAKGCEAGRHD